MQFGDYRVEVIPDTVFHLDGGAMFGVVPRTLWERQAAPDERNRVALNANCLYIEAGSERILVDTGLGDKWTAAEADRFGIGRQRTLAEALRNLAGITADDVTIVVNTHLHFDHAGGNTEHDDEGALRPAFSRARYFVSRREFEHAQTPSERDRASYLSDNWTPLASSGQLELKDDDYEIVPGLTMETVPGHSRTMQCLRLDRGGRVLFGFADLLPTVSHLPLAWVMGYDLYPAETVESKKRLLRDAAAHDWICHFYHDAERPLGRVREQNGKYIFAELEQVNGES
jgi:glyoxylase-like metal-dependent hydrolase (beta-lactamase superfamily II)